MTVQVSPAAAWRRGQFTSLLAFGAASLRPDGAAGWLDDDGRLNPNEPLHTWITCRMAHTFALGALLGVPDAAGRAELALHGLRDVLADRTDGGWFASVGPGAAVDPVKSGYAHAFVVLAGATGVVARIPGAEDVLEAGLGVLDRHFWEPGPRMLADEASRDWSAVDPYRGVNANMHGVEALLAAHDATGDRRWLDRAASITGRVIGWASERAGRIPEHFDAAWRPLPEFNADRPRDQFKPYGSTPGHGLEWSRLILQVAHAQGAAADPGWTDAAASIFDRAVADGWDAERGGFVYTVDWSGRPVEPRRFHWVIAEAVGAAHVLGVVTGDARYERAGEEWWRFIRSHVVDAERGSWHHELDTSNRPAGLTWVGKPDIYHAAQAVILPELPMAGSFASAASAAGPILG